MKTKHTKAASVLAVAVLLVGTMPVGVAQTVVQAQVDEQILAENYINAKNVYLAYVSQYTSAKENYEAAQTGDNLQEAFRTFLLAADNALIKFLEFVKAAIEKWGQYLTEEDKDNYLVTLDGHINWLQQVQENIETADTWGDLGLIALRMLDRWLNIRVDSRRIIGFGLCSIMDGIIGKAEGLSLKIEEKIENLEARGEDTRELEALLEDFNEQLASAKEKVGEARATFEQIARGNVYVYFPRGVDLLRDAYQYLKQARDDIKEIVRVLKEIGGEGEVELSGTGWVIAQGDGTADISGTGMVWVTTLSGGTLTVSKNAQVRAIGAGTVENVDDKVEYKGYGSALVTGTDISVEIQGTDLSLVAAGTGTVRLEGQGTFMAHGYGAREQTKEWSEAGIEVDLATGEEA